MVRGWPLCTGLLQRKGAQDFCMKLDDAHDLLTVKYC